MSREIGREVSSEVGRERNITHFWIASSPFFETLLLAVPAYSTGQAEPEPTKLTIYDADGALVTEAELSFPTERVGTVELGDLIRSCKHESGIQHGHLRVESPPGASVYCRISSRESATQLGYSTVVSDAQGAFFPVNFGQGRSSVLCFTNARDSDLEVKVRLFCGKRSPDCTVCIPARGSRFIALENEFSEIARTEGETNHQGYVRLGAKQECEYGVQLIDWVHGSGEGLFGTVC